MTSSSLSLNANLSLFGGKISTMRCNFTVSSTLTDTVTVNSYSFDVNAL
jgi:hypothetical protein